jgi:Flp pilus assembly protein TadD
MALDQSGMTFEMIYALHDSVSGEDYLTQVYLPWFQKYNQQMASLIEAQTGQPARPLYERLPDTTVAGQRVFGVKTRFPAMTPVASRVSTASALQDYETRLAAVDNLILIASGVPALEEMMTSVPSFQKTPARGPLAELALDLGAYLKGMQGLMAPAGQDVAIPDDIGDLTMTLELQAGELTTRTRIKVQDIQRTVGLLAALSTTTASAGPALAMEAQETQTPRPAVAQSAERKTPIERPKTAAYWMDRGGLLSAYGNYTAAVRSYREALALNPDLTEAYFQMGVAYGELGQVAAALDAVSRAIDRMPTNGAYFYGRGRIYLRAGETDLAMKDFMEAGFLGNEDARIYLEAAGVDLN